MQTIAKYIILCIIITANAITALAQFPPQHPYPGNNAIHYTDTIIKSWISKASLERGWQDIQDTTLGKATHGDSTSVIGAYNNQVVSLGDSGIMTLFFEAGIKNGDGPDFAIFENGIVNLLDSSLAFLELAFVEVSTNGIDYIRFPTTTNVQDTLQLTNADFIDASQINNFAGKYRAAFGTPFDLEELKNEAAINVDSIYYIRLIDVIGSIDTSIGTFDGQGNIVNDPYPTAFPSSGFDLNSIGVIHNILIDSNTNSISKIHKSNIQIYPNPSEQYIYLNPITTISEQQISVLIYNPLGQIVMHITQHNLKNPILIGHLANGKYHIQIYSGNKILGNEAFIKE